MRKHCCLSIFFFLFFILSFYDAAAQFSGVKWEREIYYGNSSRPDYCDKLPRIKKVIRADNDEVFVVGRIFGECGNPVLGRTFVSKINSEGTILWTKWFDKFWVYWYYKEILEAAPSSDGGLFLLTAEQSSGYEQWDTTPGLDFEDSTFYAEHWTDIYLCKISADGNLQWGRSIGGKREDYGNSLEVDIQGNVLIAGQTWSAFNDFAGKRRYVDSLSYWDYSKYDSSNNDAFVMKVSPTGELLNIKCYGGSSSDRFVHIQNHPTQGYVVAGYSRSKDLDLPPQGATNGVWILHLDTALNIIKQTIIDSLSTSASSFIVKDKKMYLSGLSKFIEIGANGANIREHNSPGVMFDSRCYFDKSGFVYKPIDGNTVHVYDSTLNIVDTLIFPGWNHGISSIDGSSRNNIYLSGFERVRPELNYWMDGLNTIVMYSNAVLNFSEQYNFVTGQIFLDHNHNGKKDAGEKTVKNVKVEADKNGTQRTVISEIDGRYSMPLDSGKYTISVSGTLSYYSIAPVSAIVQFPGFDAVDTINFALQPIPNKKDLQINLLPLNIARPGFEANYKIVGYNKGTVAIPNVQVKMLKDVRVNYSSAVPVVSSTNADTLIWNIGTLEPLDSFFIDVKGRVQAPPAVNNSDTLIHKAFVLPLIGDEVVTDNEIRLVERVQGSYDPNDKTETHGGIITPEQLAGNDHLTYLIRFQNTGTDTAFNVMIRDTLTNKLDWSSLEMISTSHPYQLYMIKPHILEFSFPNILLVDSNRNEPASHGFIAYRIKPKSNLSIGDTVQNRAHIYFDYNLPVITNDELTILRNTVVTSVIDLNRETHQLLLYPNPSNGLVTVSKKERMVGNAVVQVTDINGRLLQQIQLGKISTDNFNQTIDISGLPSGIYVVKLEVGKTSYLTKFVLQ